MSRSAHRLASTVFSILTAGSLAFGASQALARTAAPAADRSCPPDCNAYCRELYGPQSTGRCTLGGCLCVQPAP